jgi:hypothetical protein
VTCDSNVHVAEVAGLDFLRDISVEGPTRSCSKALVPGTGMAAGGLFAVSAFWLPTRIFVSPGHITQCIHIFRELFFKPRPQASGACMVRIMMCALCAWPLVTHF